MSTRSKYFGNRKGKNAGCRNYAHVYTMAHLQLKKEHFMNARDMRAY